MNLRSNPGSTSDGSVGWSGPRGELVGDDAVDVGLRPATPATPIPLGFWDVTALNALEQRILADDGHTQHGARREVRLLLDPVVVPWVLGGIVETYRLPMCPPMPESKQKILKVLRDLGLLKAALV